MTLPTPEKLAARVSSELDLNPDDVSGAQYIHADREAIAKAVESLRHEPDLRELPGNEAGYDGALDDVLAILRAPK